MKVFLARDMWDSREHEAHDTAATFPIAINISDFLVALVCFNCYFALRGEKAQR